MSFSGWLHHFAIRGCLILALLLSLVGHGQAQTNAAVPSQNTQAQKNPPPPPPVVQQQVTEAEYYKPTCDKPKTREDADLCQQLRMAKAAEDAVWWARAQSILGIIGFFGVLASLFFTGWAAITASRQVRLSRQALVQTDRAFVYVSEGILGAVVNVKSDRVESWSTGVRWKNSGNTPTKYLRLFIRLSVQAQPLADDFDFPVAEVPDVHVMIAPDGTIDSAVLPLTLEQMDGVLAGTQYLYVWGWAEYDDVFVGTPRHRTEFCYRWTVGGNVRDPKKVATRYNIHAQHNGADEECQFPLVTASPKDIGGR